MKFLVVFNRELKNKLIERQANLRFSGGNYWLFDEKTVELLTEEEIKENPIVYTDRLVI